jgi:8-oxo-dGTP diphosphatase
MKTEQKVQKQLFVVVGCIIRDGTVLMTKRTEEECVDAHMKWELPGGKVDFGENPEEAIVREIFEETGLTVEVERLLPYVHVNYWDYDWGKQQTFIVCYKCRYISGTESKEDHHIDSVEWIDLNHVLELDLLSRPQIEKFITLSQEQ